MGGRVHLGDLLRALHSAPAGGETLAAQAAGFVPRPQAPNAHAALDAEQMAQALLAQTNLPANPTPRKSGQPPAPVAVPGPEPAAPAAPQFWRVRSILPKPPSSTELPTWLTGPQAPLSCFLTDRSQPRPNRPWLHTPGHWAHSSRVCLSRPQSVAQWCERRLTNTLALGQALPPAHALRKQLRRWPHVLQVVQDLDERHGPLDHEFDHWIAQLHKHFGQRLRLRRVRGLPSASVSRGPAARADGSPVLVFSNLAPDAAASPDTEWLAFAQRITQAGGQAWVWWPGLVLGDAARAAGWQVWPLAEAAARTKPEQANTWPAERLLCCAIWGNPQVSPGLLRRLRLAACAHGFGLTPLDEVSLWHSEQVLSDAYACRLHPEANADVESDWRLMPMALRQAWCQVHLNHLAAASPLVCAEYAENQAQAWGEALQHFPALQQAREEGKALMQSAATALHGEHSALSKELQAFVQRQTQRLPTLPEQADPAWQWAWGLSHRQAWQAHPAQRPSWMTPEMWEQLSGERTWPVLQSLCIGADAKSQLLNIRQGVTQRAHIATLKAPPHCQWRAEPEPLLRRHAKVLCKLPSAELLDFFGQFAAIYIPSHEKTPHQPSEAIEVSCNGLLAAQLNLNEDTFPAWEQELLAWRRVVSSFFGADRVDQAIDERTGFMGQTDRYNLRSTKLVLSQEVPLPEDGALQLEWPTHSVTLEPFVRPTWLNRVECEGGQWRGASADGRQYLWLPSLVLGHTVRPNANRILYPAAWWSMQSAEAIKAVKARHVAPPSSGKSVIEAMDQAWGPLRRPAWAAADGIDRHGWWATWQIPHAPPQRMRFIPPGEFWMGSPLAEEGRWDDETLHPVTLTQGFWLAETTVSNALWGAVMGQAVKGEALHPKVEVSWDDVQKQFLPALRHRTGHEDWQLPSEAQWEYAARAGTQTAYPWGDAPDEQRMNIGNSVMPVDEGCPPNPWGLVHMHGNVWEWCQDGRVPLSRDPALDPLHDDKKASERVLRGSSWIGDARVCRSAVRFGYVPGYRALNFGFRLARGLEPASAQAEPGLSKPKGQKGRPEAGPPADPGRGGGVEQARGLLDRNLGNPGSNKKT